MQNIGLYEHVHLDGLSGCVHFHRWVIELLALRGALLSPARLPMLTVFTMNVNHTTNNKKWRIKDMRPECIVQA
jgi:hypothetical protein